MKDTLTEVKNNLQGINSRVDEAKNQIDDLEHKEEENLQSKQQEEKKKSKKLHIGQEPLGQLQTYQHPHHTGAGRRRESKKLKTYLKK